MDIAMHASELVLTVPTARNQVTRGRRDFVQLLSGHKINSVKLLSRNVCCTAGRDKQSRGNAARRKPHEQELEATQLAEDEKFMMAAMEEAKKAYQEGEVPVGAVVVNNGTIISRSHNRVEAEGDPTAHAEMLCIRNAAWLLGGWRLTDSTLYVTLEPCPMCAGAILQARVGAVVWGAQNTLLGADGSWVSLFPSCDEEVECGTVAMKSKIPAHPFHPDLVVRRGVLASGCSEIMKNFFQMRRKSRKTGQGNFETLFSPFSGSGLQNFLRFMYRQIRLTIIRTLDV